MEYKRFDKRIVARIDRGEELVKTVLSVADKENIRLAALTAIGASNDVILGIFNTGTKEYGSKRYNAADYELASVSGNISRKDGEPYIHLHAVIANPLMNECHAGHLSAAVISATGEIVFDLIEGELEREYSEEIGLNLLKF